MKKKWQTFLLDFYLLYICNEHWTVWSLCVYVSMYFSGWFDSHTTTICHSSLPHNHRSIQNVNRMLSMLDKVQTKFLVQILLNLSDSLKCEGIVVSLKSY